MQLYPELNVELVRVIVAVKAEHLATYTRCDGHTVRESASVAYVDLIKHTLVASWRPAAWCTSELYNAVLAVSVGNIKSAMPMSS